MRLFNIPHYTYDELELVGLHIQEELNSPEFSNTSAIHAIFLAYIYGFSKSRTSAVTRALLKSPVHILKRFLQKLRTRFLGYDKLKDELLAFESKLIQLRREFLVVSSEKS